MEGGLKLGKTKDEKRGVYMRSIIFQSYFLCAMESRCEEG